jgi:hypothetical protein
VKTPWHDKCQEWCWNHSLPYIPFEQCSTFEPFDRRHPLQIHLGYWDDLPSPTVHQHDGLLPMVFF